MKSAAYSKALSVISLAVVALASLPAAASPYTSMVVFGDSLSDSGNNSVVLGNNGGPVTGNTYITTGVYSNGPV